MSGRDLSLLIAAAAVPSLLVAWIAGFAVRRGAVGWGLVDHPGQRKIHARATPLGGGLAIWLGVIATFAMAQLAIAFAPKSLPEIAESHRDGFLARAAELWLLLAAGTVLMIMGLIDDRRGLSWRLRLFVQAFVAALVVYGQGWQLTAFLDLPVLTGALSVLWIVGLVNSFNMLDNMDGLSGGVAAIASAMLAAVLLLAPDPETNQPQLFVGGFLIVLCGAIVGFLWHNRPPARLFMGDAGSYFIGFCLAVASLLATFTGGDLPRHAILAPLCVLAVPLYDTVTVLWIRLRSGRSPFAADKNHFSHRLVELGLSKTQAVLTIYLLTATCGLGALLLHQVNAVGAAIIMVMIVCLLAIIAILESTARRQIG